MIFFRSRRGGTQRTIAAVRVLSLGALVAYPAGALTLVLAPDSLVSKLLGYGLILVALTCATVLSTSSPQRIVGEVPSQLDEFELQLRFRAMGAAYTVFSVLTLCAVIYAAVATDKQAWVPHSYEAFSGLFWGVFLYVSVLPTACLAWMLESSFDQAQ